jgi:O-acetyl-ADP-ribose deacetylase (regulator of RNase III)
MTIKFVRGDILESNCQALVNPVNCVGVMGAGLAKQFKLKYPAMFNQYKWECRDGSYKLGQVRHWYLGGRKVIINFPTKYHWKDKSTIEDIRSGLLDLRKYIVENKITSVAIPKLGCGLGGLDWKDVKLIIGLSLMKLECHIVVYE